METINARDLLTMTKEEGLAFLHDGPDGKPRDIILKFDDGEMVTNTRRTAYSQLCWDFHRRYELTPLFSSHHLQPKQRITSTSHIDVMSPIYWDCADIYGDDVDLEDLDRLSYQLTNYIYNDAVLRLSEYCETLSFDDYIAVVESPKIKEALANIRPNRESLGRCLDTIRNQLLAAPDLAKNPLAEFCRSEFISMGQVLQCVGPVGYKTEIDSNFFSKPILRGYVQGIYEIADSAAESRGASKALYYSKDHVEKGEYFNRKMQLGCSVIRHLFKGDCGTDRFLTMKVDSEDLFSIDGKYMKVPGKTGLHRIDSKKDRNWILKELKTIEIRSGIHCNMLGHAGVCQTCFGELGRSIVRGSNLGHVSSSVLCHDASQSVLSVKHDDSTNEFDKVVLGEVEEQYLEVSTDDASEVRVMRPTTGTNYRLAIEERYLKNIRDVTVAKDIDDLVPSNTTAIHDMELWFVDEDGFDQVVCLTAANGARLASFTKDMLRYVRDNPWVPTEDGRYVFDLKDWTFELPMFVLPIKHANMIEFIVDIETFVRSSGQKEAGDKNRDRLINYDNLDEGLLAFRKLVATKLKINLGHLEVIIASTTAIAHNDYRLPQRASDGVVVSYEELIRGRSLSGALAYEHLERIYGVPETYLVKHRMSHPMDDIMANVSEADLVAMQVDRKQEEVF